MLQKKLNFVLCIFGLLQNCYSQSYQRTAVLVRSETIPGENLFIRGGISHDIRPGCVENAELSACAIPIRHRRVPIAGESSAPYVWSQGDNYLDWYGAENYQGRFQGQIAAGTPMIWTTDSSSGPIVDIDGYGYTGLNVYGNHYWMLDVDMDCAKTEGNWFEFKVYTDPTSGWEPDITQSMACGGEAGGTRPFASTNHVAQCGKFNMFYYDNYGCIIGEIPTSTPTPLPPDNMCGTQKVVSGNAEASIVGGRPASLGRWPWMISLRYREGHACGANLISPKWAITAAHCLRGATPYGTWGAILRIGEHNRDVLEGIEGDYFIKNIIRHEGYGNGEVEGDNDVALLELTYPVDMASNYINTVCLPQGVGLDEFVGRECWAAGWGSTEGTGNARRLQEVQVPVYSDAECRNHFGADRISRRQICMGMDGASACGGDSGGPLQCLMNGRWLLAGITSWGSPGCAGPSVYMRISEYVDWIYANTGVSLVYTNSIK
ncbi:unnamed protein product [Owenia fusiformis]|uniref:Peptidase S1 domain-containing protein n=1 Tax=Owenia fusiformis TaxID=6347 RepID=A0A8S4N359_OWEFU|nr:unnamed protein product [Owenia fusiformis]